MRDEGAEGEKEEERGGDGEGGGEEGEGREGEGGLREA